VVLPLAKLRVRICLEERCCLHNPLLRSFRRSRQERTPRLVHRKAREPNKGLTTAQVCGNHFFRLQKRRSSCYSRIVRPCPPLSWQQRRTNGSSLRQLSCTPAFSVTSWAVTHSSQRERAAIVDFLSALYPYALTQTLVQSSGTSGNSERGREAFGAFHPTTRVKHWRRTVTEPRRKASGFGRRRQAKHALFTNERNRNEISKDVLEPLRWPADRQVERADQ
jgi:hypothetical protein